MTMLCRLHPGARARTLWTRPDEYAEPIGNVFENQVFLVVGDNCWSSGALNFVPHAVWFEVMNADGLVGWMRAVDAVTA